MKERTALSKRKAVVVVENVLRLVEEPLETAPFLPMLLPGVERVSVEVADPECRQTAGRVLKTLHGMQAEVSAAEEEAKSGMGASVTGADVLENMLRGAITSGAREEAAAGAGGLMSDALRRQHVQRARGGAGIRALGLVEVRGTIPGSAPAALGGG